MTRAEVMSLADALDRGQRYAALLRDCQATLMDKASTRGECWALAERIRVALAEESGEQPKEAADER